MSTNFYKELWEKNLLENFNEKWFICTFCSFTSCNCHKVFIYSTL